MTLEELSSSPHLKEYAQGAQGRATRPIKSFLAPDVPVATVNGTYKKFIEKLPTHTFPKTVRALGGRATQLEVAMLNASYSCEVHGLDYPVDIAALGDADAEWHIMDGLAIVADVAAQVSERETIDKAIAATPSPTAQTWNDAADPVKLIDAQIKSLITTAKSDQIGVLFGVDAWDLFKGHAKVQARAGGDVSWERCPNLFHTGARFETSYAIFDENAEGLDESIAFMFPVDSVLLFARTDEPNRRSPDFMKTFRLDADLVGTGLAPKKDGRVVFAQVDWSEDIQVTNEAGAIRLTVSATTVDAMSRFPGYSASRAVRCSSTTTQASWARPSGMRLSGPRR